MILGDNRGRVGPETTALSKGPVMNCAWRSIGVAASPGMKRLRSSAQLALKPPPAMGTCLRPAARRREVMPRPNSRPTAPIECSRVRRRSLMRISTRPDRPDRPGSEVACQRHDLGVAVGGHDAVHDRALAVAEFGHGLDELLSCMPASDGIDPLLRPLGP